MTCYNKKYVNVLSLFLFPEFLIFFRPHLFLNLCDQPLLAGSGSGVLISGNPLLESSCWLSASWCNTLPPVPLHILFMAFTQKLNTSFTLTKHWSCMVVVTSAVRGGTATQVHFFLIFYNFMGERFHRYREQTDLCQRGEIRRLGEKGEEMNKEENSYTQTTAWWLPGKRR